jgi:orotidine-5'-phosphate decarboxylase
VVKEKQHHTTQKEVHNVYKDIRNTLFNPDFPAGFFLDPSEQEQLVAALAYYNLLKLSNARDLPLKSGGKTDIYINIRDARNHYEAIAFLADLYATAMERLKVTRFADVPQAVSCLAGSIAERARIPMITIREEAKAGRATQGLIIGDVSMRDTVAIYDDVITDGASKIVPYRTLMAKGIMPYLLVMVDRQQGWQKVFTNEGINMPVWAGTDLHTVRRHTIDTFGLIQRCDPTMEKKNPFILALDGRPWKEILPIIDQARPAGCILKINDLLHNQSRNNIVRDVGVYGRTMIDFKGHDIPTTVYNTCMQYRENPPWAVTVHASGGVEMVQAAVKAFEGTKTKVLVVTVLTSMDDATCEMIYHETRPEEAKNLAKIGEDAGCHGFVCSGNEVQELKQLFHDKEFVVPGTRSPGADTNDQKNVVTHAEAIERGATKLIGGRQFFNAPDPITELKRVMADELDICI